jgi:peptidoglycan/LPS O-acetylase OafA/YrhL
VWAAIAPHAGWAGLACYLLAIVLARDSTQFPGWWAVWPVAGTVFLLAAGPRDPVNRHAFAQPVLRFYGRIGYPLYLWHWPVLCFPLLLGVPLSVDVRVLILLVGVVLAALTHELVEKPFARLRPSRSLSMLLLAALAVCASLGAFVAATGGMRFTFPAELQSSAGLGGASGH